MSCGLPERESREAGALLGSPGMAEPCRQPAMRPRLCEAHVAATSRWGPAPTTRRRAASARREEPGDDQWWEGGVDEFFDFEPVLVLPDRRWGGRTCRRWMAATVFVLLVIASAAIALQDHRTEPSPRSAVPVAAGLG